MCKLDWVPINHRRQVRFFYNAKIYNVIELYASVFLVSFVICLLEYITSFAGVIVLKITSIKTMSLTGFMVHASIKDSYMN